MSNSFINFTIASSAFPFVQPKVNAPVNVTPPVPVSVLPPSTAPATPATTTSITVTTTGATSGEKWYPLTLPPTDVDKALKPLNYMVNELGQLTTVLQAVLKIIELYISDFSSVSKVLSSLTSIVSTALDNLVKDIDTAGVYMNIVNIPALSREANGSFNLSKFNTGGFQGFLTRLQTSLNNTADLQRPVFGDTSVVGGFIILVDAPAVADFFLGLQQLASAFNMMQGISVSPPAPRNLRGRPGFFSKSGKENEGKLFYGIQLEWDKPAGFAFEYAISRSQTAGGEEEDDVPYVPSSLMGKDGLFPTVEKMFATWDFTWPTVSLQVYNDPDFNGGSPVLVPANLNGGGTYIDYLGDYVDSSGKPKANMPPQLSYVVQSMSTLIPPSPEDLAQQTMGIGSPSNEATVTLKLCDDTATSTGVILHKEGFFEFLAPGLSPVGNWSSMQIKLMVPYLTELVGLLQNFVNQLSGLAVSATDSFIDFGNQIVTKIQTYIGMVNTITRLITELEKFIIGANVSWLYVPPAKGGVNGFMESVKSAIVPVKTVNTPVLDAKGNQVFVDAKGNVVPEGTPGSTAKVTTTTVGFSGPGGMSCGLVMMFGAGVNATTSEKAEFTAIENVFNLLGKTWKNA